MIILWYRVSCRGSQNDFFKCYHFNKTCIYVHVSPIHLNNFFLIPTSSPINPKSASTCNPLPNAKRVTVLPQRPAFKGHPSVNVGKGHGFANECTLAHQKKHEWTLMNVRSNYKIVVQVNYAIDLGKVSCAAV